jgi:fatty acid desaturase
MLKRSDTFANGPESDPPEQIAPVSISDTRVSREGWTARLVLYSRVVAGLTMLKGLYHWAAICGFGVGPVGGFEAENLGWQIATVFFAIIDPVAAVGLWLAAPWGAVVWLASAVTLIVVHALLPQIYGFQPIIIAIELALIGGYGYFAFQASREQPRRL